uniref:Uncharacterized protein n=1 Tax=Oryzias latipes TaxID=8090 RepID=A0A3P9I043_ORYLA
MKLAVVLACFVVFCLAEKPLPCTSPPLLTGGFIVTTQNEKVGIFGKYLYDALGQRVRLFDIGSFKNKTFTADVLLHYSDVSHSQSPFFCLQEISTASCDSKKTPSAVYFNCPPTDFNSCRFRTTCSALFTAGKR